jgi:hypothetical protein
MCTVGFVGKGYSPAFVQNYLKIQDSLTDETPIQVTDVTDSICAPCPHRRDDLCETQDKIAELDRKHAKVLGITAGDVLTWGQAKMKIQEHFTEEVFHDICAECSWRPLGICLQAVQNLK